MNCRQFKLVQPSWKYYALVITLQPHLLPLFSCSIYISHICILVLPQVSQAHSSPGGPHTYLSLLLMKCTSLFPYLPQVFTQMSHLYSEAFSDHCQKKWLHCFLFTMFLILSTYHVTLLYVFMFVSPLPLDCKSCKGKDFVVYMAT